MKRWLQLVICIAILVVLGGIGTLLVLTAPEAEKKDNGEELQVVEFITVQPESIDLRLPTQGMIVPEKQSLLAAEIPGKVVWVSDKFKAGGVFKKDEEILRIDDSDYKAAEAEAAARLADAQLAEKQEKAQAERSLRDWQQLGLEGEPGELVLRIPQLKSAAARVKAAEAAVKKAENDVKRTTIRAPYPARIREIHTEVGSYLGPSAPVADIYKASPYELVLPLSLADFAFALPITEEKKPIVWLETGVGTETLKWQGEVVRQTGEIDRESRSVNLVAQIKASEGDWLQPGLFVRAAVEGRTLQRVFRVPLAAFYESDKLVIVDPKDQLWFRTVKVIRREGDDAFVTEGLNPGERVCTTALEAVIEGMDVEVRDPPKPKEEEKPGPNLE